ncbi:MAG TPA: HD domain-containing protein [Ktedonobacterales bacterium]
MNEPSAPDVDAEPDSRSTLLARAEQFAREVLGEDASGHDWSHIDRVRRLARVIAADEGADVFVCEISALLHDIADEKIAGDETVGLRRVREWLAAQEADDVTADHVLNIIATMSFAGGDRPPMATIEGKVVQDADRLDAIGAVGVARAFAYGGSRGRPMHDPSVLPRASMSREEYRHTQTPTINHFYEKLLLLKDRLNTTRARQLAEARHRFMLDFLDEFFAESDGRA